MLPGHQEGAAAETGSDVEDAIAGAEAEARDALPRARLAAGAHEVPPVYGLVLADLVRRVLRRIAPPCHSLSSGSGQSANGNGMSSELYVMNRTI